jgi:hypothetical protein
MKLFELWGKFGAAMIEIPFVAARSMLTQHPERGGLDGRLDGQLDGHPNGHRDLEQAGWKAYDAWVQLLNESANGLYASPEVGSSVGRSMEASLKWQRLGSAMREAFFAAVWPAVGLPSAVELTELRAEVGALRDDLAMARLEAEEARAAEIKVPVDEHQVGDPLTAMWNRGWPPATAPFERAGGKDAPAN